MPAFRCLRPSSTSATRSRPCSRFGKRSIRLNPAEVPNLDKAKLNVWELAQEILERLTSEQGRGRQENEETTDIAGAA